MFVITIDNKNKKQFEDFLTLYWNKKYYRNKKICINKKQKIIDLNQASQRSWNSNYLKIK